MEATPGMHVEWVGDEAVVLDPSNGHVHYLNPPSALFYGLVLEHGFDGALDRLRTLHPEAPEDDIHEIVEQMTAAGLLAR